MNARQVLEAAHRLQQNDQAFALVSVLRVEAPASARPGDKAVVTADGIIHGWIGGGCAQPPPIQPWMMPSAVTTALSPGLAEAGASTRKTLTRAKA